MGTISYGTLFNEIAHYSHLPMVLLGQSVPRILGHPYVQGAIVSGSVGYYAGSKLNRAIERYWYDDRSSIGSEWYDLLNQPGILSFIQSDKINRINSLSNPVKPNITPDQAGDDIQREFCWQNPDAPNCQYQCE